MARFLLEHYKGLRPSRFESLVSGDDSQESEEGKSDATFDKMYEPWCDYLAALFLANKVKKDRQVC